MLYGFFLILAIAYNAFKFSKEREFFLQSLVDAGTEDHRNMILTHHFHIFMFEASIGMIAAILLSDSVPLGIVITGLIYICFVFFGLYLYQYFLKYLEKKTSLELRHSFNRNFLKEFRVSFSIMFIPILLYSILSWTFQENDFSADSGFAFIEIILNVIFVSVLTISCTVAVMLKLIPHRDITENAYSEIIKKRLNQIGLPDMRVKWIETDMKNAFVVGLQLWRFSNQTMFIGKKLRELLTPEEFDAVVAHELAHVANRHIQKRVVELVKTFLLVVVGSSIVFSLFFTLSYLIFDEDVRLYFSTITIISTWAMLLWLALSYSFFFDIIRSHEYEADAYAVLELGASKEALISALKKITSPEEGIPDYVKKKQNSNKTVFSGITKFFSTHPSIEDRERMLQMKVFRNLPFDYYISLPHKLRKVFSYGFNWKFLGATGVSFAFAFTWIVIQLNHGKELVALANKLSNEEIIKNERLVESINVKPKIFGPSLMHSIVKRQDPTVIDYFLRNGANPARTMVYLIETKNMDLFKHFYSQYERKLSLDEYYLVLHKSAEINFTEGYRYLVNAPRFESLKSEFKMSIAAEQANRPSTDRKPASTEAQ